MEIGILSRLAPAQIASFTGLPVQTVRVYEQLFFNVRDMLDVPGYVMGRILQPVMMRMLPMSDTEMMWKLVAYCAGWDDFVSFMGYGTISDEVQQKVRFFFVHSEEKRAVLAPIAAGVTPQNAGFILQSVYDREIAKITRQQPVEEKKADALNDSYSYVEAEIRRMGSTFSSASREGIKYSTPDELRYLPPGLDLSKEVADD